MHNIIGKIGAPSALDTGLGGEWKIRSSTRTEKEGPYRGGGREGAVGTLEGGRGAQSGRGNRGGDNNVKWAGAMEG